MTDNRTTELRKKLTERGVKYQAIGKRLTYWNRDGSKNDCDDADFVADEQNGYLIVEGLTPEQAIAATLGTPTLIAEQVVDAVLDNFEETHETRYDHWEPSKFDWQAITDELNAELGSGTCEMEHVKSGARYDVWRCSACCYEYAESVSETSIVQNYCPNCGKAVKR